MMQIEKNKKNFFTKYFKEIEYYSKISTTEIINKLKNI
jgi:hypothetical protein